MRRSGVVERAAFRRPSPGASSARFARRGLSLQGRRAFRIGVRDQPPGGGPADTQQVRAEIARTVWTGSLPLHPSGAEIGSGLKPRVPKAHRITDYAERSDFVETVLTNPIFRARPGRSAALPTPSAAKPREAAKSVVRLQIKPHALGQGQGP